MDETVKRDLCAREPIHVPGSIQPHGLLLVLDAETGLVLQTAGDPRAVFGDGILLPGASLAAVLEGQLTASLHESCRDLGSTPVYLGNLQATPQHPTLTMTAHRVAGQHVIEIEPAGSTSLLPVVLSFIRASVERMNSASGLEDACRSIAADVRHLTGYDRIMIYRFLQDGSGCVIAEEKRDDLPALLHHRFPGSDVPPQARELYRRNLIRVIPDVAYAPAPLVPAFNPQTGQALDMSHCSLRSVSPVHIQYLKNMGVGASMSVSILKKGELWGLIACHHSGPKLVPFEAREVCQHLGQALSHAIEARDDAEELSQGLELARARDRIFTELAAASDPLGFVALRISEIQAVIPSDGMIASIGSEVASSGHVPPPTALAALTDWVTKTAQPTGVFVTNCLSEHYAAAGEFTANASGLLAVVLPGTLPVVLMWFRAEQLQEVHWAGNPHEAVQPDPRSRGLSPRKSFALWSETVCGRSRPWSRVEIEAAHLLRARGTLVLQEFQIRQMNMQIRSANERLSALARTDDLTGLANRRALGERLQEEWARVVRYGRGLAVVAIDVDHFKTFNDHLGHPAGDDCLRKVAGILGATGRPTDFASRSGGEEFVILLPETDLAGAQAVAEGIRAAIERLRIRHPASPIGVVTVSLGVAATAEDVLGAPERLMEDADKALYLAKREGRNRVALASPHDPP